MASAATARATIAHAPPARLRQRRSAGGRPRRPHRGRGAAPHAGRRRSRGGAARRARVIPPPDRRWRRSSAPGQRVAISVCDVTRAQPRQVMLEAIFAELPQVRARRRHHPGRHRHPPRQHAPTSWRACWAPTSWPATASSTTTPATTRRWSIAGTHVARACRSGCNRDWLDADVRITTGFVEPHFFAGFSGGPKMVAPGLAGLATMLVLHDAAAHRPSQRHLGHHRRQPDPRRRARDRAAHRRAPSPSTWRSTAIRRSRRCSPATLFDEHARRVRLREGHGDVSGGRRSSTWCSRPTPAIRSTRTSTRP